MAAAVEMRMRLPALCGWSLLAMASAGALGAYPTWRLAGSGGLAALLAAGAVVLVATIAGGVAIRRFTARGPAGASAGVMLAFLVRLAVCPAGGVGAWAVLGVPPVPLAVWLAALWAAGLLAEVVWLVRAAQAAPPEQEARKRP